MSLTRQKRRGLGLFQAVDVIPVTCVQNLIKPAERFVRTDYGTPDKPAIYVLNVEISFKLVTLAA